VAFEIPDGADEVDFLMLASAYENLARELRQPFDWTIVGTPHARRKAIQSWQNYLSCGVAFRVIAAWLRALGNLNRDSHRCQYCYRHRVTKLRCLVHGSPVNESPAARRGRAISPIYVNWSVALSNVAKIRKSLESSLVVNSVHWRAVLPCVQTNGVPPSLARSTAILAVQLRRLRVVIGSRFENEASSLFLDMVRAATAAVVATIDSGDAKQRADEAPYLVTLANFLKLWFGRAGQIMNVRFPELKALGYDPYHPIVTSGSFLDTDVAICLLLQHAWCAAEEEFSNETMIDREQVLKLRSGATPLSLREIGKQLGCSYETVRRLIAAAPIRKYQRLN
jgi:hypothetical protein